LKKNVTAGFGLLITTLLLFSACAPSSALLRPAVTINVYNWGEYIGEDTVGAFEEETGIRVNYTTYLTNEEMYAKIKSGGGDYDVIIPSDYMISRMIEEDMLERLDFSTYRVFRDRRQFQKSRVRPRGRYSVPYMWGTVGIIYNTAMVDDPVDSWDILWKGNTPADSHVR
jgi:spermidine/putrescine transport system substrate-binding protein